MSSNQIYVKNVNKLPSMSLSTLFNN